MKAHRPASRFQTARRTDAGRYREAEARRAGSGDGFDGDDFDDDVRGRAALANFRRSKSSISSSSARSTTAATSPLDGE
jgi:hypothetical protein